ncbi:uncharacterized protein MKZ38_009189 [Zalerion maritima]|uniref:Xylanolytic transcriptional activator regulatory domain-containing protein n=1 Tax=Zalerion maritima TaxID=339359 RepID=A0AAD5RUE1_9PEZI|nr:uncharacterized protein MKZ38_009189 [Zalerion maritima]
MTIFRHGGNRDERDHDDDDCGEYDDNDDDRRHWKGRSRGRTFTFSEHGAGAASNQVLVESAIRNPSTLIVRPKQEWDEKGEYVGHGDSSAPSARRRSSYSAHAPLDDQPGGPRGHPPEPMHLESHRVPFFRYFGPTAIVPGFKQMVVSVKDRKRSLTGMMPLTSPGSLPSYSSMGRRGSQAESDLGSLENLPVYDPNDPSPLHPLIEDLVKLFFLHLGANFPFWKEDKFLRLVQEKRVEPILVDSVCALAARYSDLSVFTILKNGRLKKWKYGTIFAQRAKERIPDLFAVSAVATVQAFLLLAYEAFGANQDSALWMYLGCAIRMAVDLGLPKLIGVKYQGEKDPWNARTVRRCSDEALPEKKDDEILTPEEQLEVEKERIDTVWSILVLDRAVSAGTGRLITLKGDDIELPLPEQIENSSWPDPYPPFVQILHLYGRALDVLNNIMHPKDLTQETTRRLVKMESDLTQIYHKQDPRLRFDVNNFSEHVRLRQGPAFILLHLWFHALIIILHQPTLLKPFRNTRMHQLAPKSRELAMSSAKTIADILAFSDLIDTHSFIGIPFTSQPMYIAACAFLMESESTSSQPASRETSPPSTDFRMRASGSDSHPIKSHSLLVSKANDNYKRCYSSLGKLNEYWGGVKYILTALDQKSKGIWDCETYTLEEYESTKLPRRGSSGRLPRFDPHLSPRDPAVAYSLTGTTNSPNPSVTRLLFQSVSRATPQPPIAQPAPISAPAPVSAQTPPGNMIYDPIRQSLPDPRSVAMFPPAYPQPATSAVRHSIHHQPKPHRLSTSSITSMQSQSSSNVHSSSQMRYESTIVEDMNVCPDVKMQLLGSLSGGGGTSQPTPHHTFTPSSQHSQSSPYGASPPIMHGSPASTHNTVDHHMRQQPHPHALSHSSASGTGSNPNSATAAAAAGVSPATPGAGPGTPNLGAGPGPDFAQSGLASGSYYMVGGTTGPLTGTTDILSFDCQEVDISSLALPGGDMSSWYLPNEVVGYLEAGGGAGAG